MESFIEKLKNNLSEIEWFDVYEDWEWLKENFTSNDEEVKELNDKREEIIEFMTERRELEVMDELFYLECKLQDLKESVYNITEEEIHDYIKTWFRSNG